MLLDPLPEENKRDQREQLELTTPFGSFKAFTRDINTVATVATFCLSALIAYILWTHQADAREGSKELAHAMREQAQAAREQTCIMRFDQHQRQQNAEFCKQVSR